MTNMARPKKFDESATLKKAMNVFWKNGYAATSMSELVKAMDINPPSLYDTYGDKHGLFLMALKVCGRHIITRSTTHAGAFLAPK